MNMEKKKPAYNLPAIHLACIDVRRGLLNLLLELVPHGDESSGEKGGAAVPPTPTAIEIDDWIKAWEFWSSAGLPLLAELPVRACPACDFGTSHFVFQSYDGYHFNECERCGTWYAPLVVDWALFERFFAECPAAREVAKKVSTRRFEQLASQDLPRFDGYLRSALDLLPASTLQRRYLDIGCGVGHSLTAAKAAGMLPHGVEADPDLVALAKINHAVIAGRVSDLPDGVYDVISMWETLEHLADPLSILQEAVTRLSPGGLVAVTVPNLDTLPVRILREKCSYAYGGYNSPGHINFFNRRSIENLFERAGLALIDVSYEFSNNAPELFGYLGSLTASDRLYAVGTPPPHIVEILNVIWQTVTLLEEFAETLPIMHCVVCRIEDVSLFSKKCDERSATRRERLIAAARHQLVALSDPERQLRELTEQHIKMHGHLQAEVNKRDQMLAELQRQLNNGLQC